MQFQKENDGAVTNDRLQTLRMTNSINLLNIGNLRFKIGFKFEKTKIKILSKSLKFATGIKPKPFIDETNKIR